MSEELNQEHKIQATELPAMSNGSQIPYEPPHLLKRVAFVLAFILFVGITIVLTPQIAKRIAYSWTVGVERAKAEVARQFLDENPVSGQRIAWVAKAVSPSVVGIFTIGSPEEVGRSGRRGNRSSLVTSYGSGVIVDNQGYLVTNNHVIENAHLIRVGLSDGRTVEAEVVGRDRAVDLAVLRIDEGDLKAISWGDSRQVAVGEQVIAVGSPYNLRQTVTSGVISATERYIPTSPMPGLRHRSPHEYLQTDAAINQGNSGGALVDMNGKLIGICAAIISDEIGNSGIGFAIPSFLAKRVYDEIVSHGEVKHGWIGVIPSNVTLQESQRIGQKKPMGAVIRDFLPRSSARDAGLRRGDILLRWGETEITEPLHLVHLVLLSKPGTKETIEVFRGGEVLTFEITIGVRPTDF